MLSSSNGTGRASAHLPRLFHVDASQAAEYAEVDARVGAVAVALGLVSEAQKLFAGCGRYDLLNKLHQAAGEWDSALAVAERHDRIHLRATHFQLARHLESMDDPAGAVRHYEAAEAGAAEVPRMLYGAGELGELERCGHSAPIIAISALFSFGVLRGFALGC